MAASSAVVANRALRHLGVRGRITTLSTDVTAEGVALNELYLPVVLRTLKDVPWRFARKKAALALVETLADGTGASGIREWTYSYRQPEDCLQPLRVPYGGIRRPNPMQEPSFEVVADTTSTDYAAGTTYAVGEYARSASIWYRCILAGTGQTPASSPLYWVAVTTVPPLIRTDVEDAYLEYTYDVSADPTRFAPDFEEAVAARLAYEVAPSITVNGSIEPLVMMVADLYNTLAARAMKNDWDAAEPDLPPVSLYQTVRASGWRG